MRIGINALFLRPGKNGGIETYFRELLSTMISLAPTFDYVAYVPREAKDYRGPEQLKIVVVPISASNPTEKYVLEQTLLPYYVVRDRIDILHSLAYIAPLHLPCASVVTVHDLNFKAFGHLLPLPRRVALSSFCYASCRSAHAVVAVSEFTRRALIRELGLARHKVAMIYEAGARLNLAVSNFAGLPPHYIVAFGGRFPNKNIGRLLVAFARIADQIVQNLVIIGEVHKSFAQVWYDLPEGARKRIRWLGSLTNEEVASVLRGSDAYVHPSIYEGFGMPIVEAQALGIPVVASSVSAIPEIGGDGAKYFDPFSVEDIAAALGEVLLSQQFRDELRQRGAVNARRFSWDRTARKTLELYKSLCN